MFGKFAELYPVLVLRGCLVVLAVLAVVAFVWALRRFGVFARLAATLESFESLPRPQQVLAALCVAPLVVGLVGYGANKAGGGTNDAPSRMSAPRGQVTRSHGATEVAGGMEGSVYHYPVDSRTREELRSVYDGIAVAYSNRQTAVMRRIFSEVRGRTCSLTDDDFRYVMHCVYSAYDDALFVQRGACSNFRPPVDFSDVAVFRRYADALLELVRITADANIARKGHGVCKGVEAIPLRLLKEYRKKFGAEGRRELEACADRLVAEWIAFIESDAGYSHAYARCVFPGNLRLYEQEGESREDAVRATRLLASVELETFGGYVPKWLDEIK